MLFSVLFSFFCFSQGIYGDDGSSQGMGELLLNVARAAISNTPFSLAASVANFNKGKKAFPFDEGTVIRSGNPNFCPGLYTGQNLSGQENGVIKK